MHYNFEELPINSTLMIFLDMIGQTLAARVRGLAGRAGKRLLARVDPLVGSHPLLVAELPVRFIHSKY